MSKKLVTVKATNETAIGFFDNYLKISSMLQVILILVAEFKVNVT